MPVRLHVSLSPPLSLSLGLNICGVDLADHGVSLACRLWPKIENWLGSFTILRGLGPVLLKSCIFVILEGGGVWTHCPRSGSVHALHPSMSKSRDSVLLIFQCPGICLTPVQVDILVSDDSLAFCPFMYNGVFTWVHRVKSEVGTVKHVEALQFFLFRRSSSFNS